MGLNYEEGFVIILTPSPTLSSRDLHSGSLISGYVWTSWSSEKISFSKLMTREQYFMDCGGCGNVGINSTTTCFAPHPLAHNI
jgi:hypothetical protein